MKTEWSDIEPRSSLGWHGEGYFIGKTIVSVEFDDKSEYQEVAITLKSGEVVVGHPIGDCCSSSWIEHISIPPDIEGAEVTGVQEASIDDLDPSDPRYRMLEAEKEYPDCIRVYWTAIQTTKGEIIMEYRNSSNGYYGGSISWGVRG